MRQIASYRGGYAALSDRAIDAKTGTASIRRVKPGAGQHYLFNAQLVLYQRG
jgi:hypothetical protein